MNKRVAKICVSLIQVAALLSLLQLPFWHDIAVAQQTSNSSPAEPASRQTTRTDSQGRKITVVDFDEARIEGTAKAPDGFFLRSRNSSKADNIMSLRKNFHRRMRSVGHEGLRAVPMN